MSTALTLPNGFGNVSTVFAGGPVDDNLSSGITGGFSVMSYKGKVWSIRSGGTEIPLMRADGDGPRGSIEVVIVKSSPFISKVYYEKGYVPGSDEAPDCFSNNGTTPDPSVQAPKSPSCASCPMNAWGSRVNNQTGKQGKACADSKRLAIMPLEDLDNKSKIGPMLLRVPAASLQDTKNYAHALKGYGYDYFTVGTRISFDAQEAFPKFLYNAIRPLTDAEAQLCLTWRNSPEVDNILNAAEVAPKPATDKPATPFEQPPATTAPAQDGTIAAQIAALQAQLQAQNAPKPAEPPPPPPAPEKTAQQLEIERLQAALAAAQNPPPPPPPPAKTPQELEIERLQAALAAAQTPAPAPVPEKTPEQLQMEALQKQLADMNAAKAAQEAKAAEEAKAEKERKKAERAAKKAAEEAAKKAAEEANAETTTAPAPTGADATLAALQAQLAALQAGQGTGQVLQGEVIPPTPAPTPTPAPAAENALSTASIEAKLAALMGKTA